MHKKSLDISSSVEWLNNGKILAHPTEGIWGLGCNALDKNSFNKLYDLKKRNHNKSFILLVQSVESIKKYLNEISKEDTDYLDKVWPGPTTILISYNDNLPIHLHNNTGKLAIRVSNHLPLKQLIEGFNGFMVSTSANISGEPYINNPDKILDSFGDIDLAYYDAPLGSNNKPSKIIDLDTKKVIRK